MLEKGKIHYNEKGLPRCHICGKPFKKVLSHAWQKHGINAMEYKKKYGLDTSKGIVCKETKEKLQKAINDNYDIVVKDNLLNKGVNTRYKKGCKGRTRDKVSLQTLMVLSSNRFKKNK